MEIDKNLFIEDVQDSTDEEYDIADRIFQLKDHLSEEIIFRNIEESIRSKDAEERVNYVTLFRNKYKQITPDHPLYNKEYLYDSIGKIGRVVLENLEDCYGVTLGEQYDDYVDLDEYLEDLETLYEFFVVRNYENLRYLLFNELMKRKKEFAESYASMDEGMNEDLFFSQSKKKFKDYDDSVIMHYLTDIISDICSSEVSALNLYNKMVNISVFEEYNFRMNKLIENYGNRLVITDDVESAKKYFSVLNVQSIFYEMRNDIINKYIERAELA